MTFANKRWISDITKCYLCDVEWTENRHGISISDPGTKAAIWEKLLPNKALLLIRLFLEASRSSSQLQPLLQLHGVLIWAMMLRGRSFQTVGKMGGMDDILPKKSGSEFLKVIRTYNDLWSFITINWSLECVHFPPWICKRWLQRSEMVFKAIFWD